jgi:hypothetical protein
MNTPFGSQEHCMDKVIGSYTEQEINDQIATINSLTISDLHHPMDIVDT